MATRKYLPYRRRQLGLRLRELRCADPELTRPKVGDLLGVTHQTISNMELGVHKVRKAELALLLETYGADPATRTALEQARARAERRDWWPAFGVPEWQWPALDLETEAAAIRTVEPDRIPVLLQTEAYARACGPDAEVVLERQRRAFDRDVRVQAILGEGALHRLVGGPAVFAEQLAQLLKSPVELRVLPFEAGAHPAMAGALTVFEFDEPGLPRQAFAEYPAGGVLIEDPAAADALARLCDQVLEATLSVKKSRKLVESQLDQLR